MAKACAILTAFLATSIVAGASEPPKTASPTRVKATVIAVSPTGGTLTIQLPEKIVTVAVTNQVRLLKDGKEIDLSQLLPGQTVELSGVDRGDGQLVIHSITVIPNTDPLEAAGSPRPKWRPRLSDRPIQRKLPFDWPPNPANVQRPPVSPH